MRFSSWLLVTLMVLFVSPAMAQLQQGTLTLPSGVTTAYMANQLIANNATAGSVVVPSFVIRSTSGNPVISRVRLDTNDATAGAWNGQTVQVDLWSAPPTFTNGDRGAWAIATGSVGHLGAFSCVMSAEQGDGAWSECAPAVGSYIALPSGQTLTLYWSLEAITGSGTTGSGKTFTLFAEGVN